MEDYNFSDLPVSSIQTNVGFGSFYNHSLVSYSRSSALPMKDFTFVTHLFMKPFDFLSCVFESISPTRVGSEGAPGSRRTKLDLVDSVPSLDSKGGLRYRPPASGTWWSSSRSGSQLRDFSNIRLILGTRDRVMLLLLETGLGREW